MAIENVCSSCFEDEDLQTWIRNIDGPPGCDACGLTDAPTSTLEDICSHIEFCISKYWGLAVEQLPYESAEGGYQSNTWNTTELIVDKVGLVLPRDKNDRLLDSIIYGLRDDLWCDYDWLTLDHDIALRTSWKQFCEVIKHKRRFFFHSIGADDRDSYSPVSLLNTIAELSQGIGLIRELKVGTNLWRARPDIEKKRRVTSADFGPPPIEFALQSNRMNPPGIPMLYLASSAKTALRETRAQEAKIGLWRTNRQLRILDLRNLPSIPGLFSDTDRNDRLGLRFLHGFAKDIMKPVERDQRVHVDYLPSQVVTEFMRDYEFHDGKIDGISYNSTVHNKGWNIALFLGMIELGLEKPKWGKVPAPSLRFEKAIRLTEQR